MPSAKERAAAAAPERRGRAAAHLDGEIGARRRVLAEPNDMGRTEHFTPVRLAAPAEPGVIVDPTITGHDGRQLSQPKKDDPDNSHSLFASDPAHTRLGVPCASPRTITTIERSRPSTEPAGAA